MAKANRFRYANKMQNPDGTSTKLRRSINEPGHAHALTFSCYQKLPLLSKDRTRCWLIEAIDAARRTLELELWAYVIMPDHAHVMLLPLRDDYRMSDILKAIKQPVARQAIAYLKRNDPAFLNRLQFPNSNGRVNHRFWQAGGGYDRNITNAQMAWNLVTYIHENPVRRGLVDTQTDWIWSSAQWYEGSSDVPLSMDACPPDS